MINYCFVIDGDGKRLSPTKENRGWYLVRKGKAKLVSKYPMVIQLAKVIPVGDIDRDPIYLGIDDGSKFVGFGLVQMCKTRNKVLFKGLLEHRNDVSKKMDVRREYRKRRRSRKRYRKERFSNRGSSKREGRLVPSIKQKRDVVIRVVTTVNKWLRIDRIFLEDVQFDVRSLVEGHRLYRWEYQKSNRLDENLRKATLMRDTFSCKNCGKRKCRLEVHHIVPRRLNGPDSVHNLITLCVFCHQLVTGCEVDYQNRFFDLINRDFVRTTDAQHSMQGKRYLQKELEKIAELVLTCGGDTANRRIDYGIEKSHCNDALVTTGLSICSNDCELREWLLKPIRKKKSTKVYEMFGFRHRDFVRYTKRNGEYYEGYITALSLERKVCNIRLVCGKVLVRYGIGNLSLLYRFKGIYWFNTKR